jgi:hypothetical protein
MNSRLCIESTHSQGQVTRDLGTSVMKSYSFLVTTRVRSEPTAGEFISTRSPGFR